jgi:hypothetical protein
VRIIIEVRENGGLDRLERDTGRPNWLDEKRNAMDRREAVLGMVNDLLRLLELDEIKEV